MFSLDRRKYHVVPFNKAYARIGFRWGLVEKADRLIEPWPGATFHSWQQLVSESFNRAQFGIGYTASIGYIFKFLPEIGYFRTWSSSEICQKVIYSDQDTGEGCSSSTSSYSGLNCGITFTARLTSNLMTMVEFQAYYFGIVDLADKRFTIFPVSFHFGYGF